MRLLGRRASARERSERKRRRLFGRSTDTPARTNEGGQLARLPLALFSARPLLPPAPLAQMKEVVGAPLPLALFSARFALAVAYRAPKNCSSFSPSLKDLTSARVLGAMEVMADTRNVGYLELRARVGLGLVRSGRSGGRKGASSISTHLGSMVLLPTICVRAKRMERERVSAGGWRGSGYGIG
jgi:hypothetical protein